MLVFVVVAVESVRSQPGRSEADGGAWIFPFRKSEGGWAGEGTSRSSSGSQEQQSRAARNGHVLFVIRRSCLVHDDGLLILQ